MRSLIFLSLVAVGCGGSKMARLASPEMAYAGGAPMSPSEAAPSTELYADYGKNPWVAAAEDRFSTFAADVDTASYTIARRKLVEGTLPPQPSVRVEEWVNYFRYSFPAPERGPFSIVMDAAPHPFAPEHYILRVGVATKTKTVGERKPSALVFLVDVSGSMSSEDKLPLAKQALHILTDHLSDKDAVALVTYAGDSRVILPMTSIDHKDRIHAAIEQLRSGGSTAMASGIDTAYELAAKWIRPGAISRVIVLTDGDANVGPHSYQDMLKIIADRAKQGVALSTIGFGMGNYKDATMEQLADKGNGNNYYIDSLAAAKRVFAEQLTSTLEVAAKDVKLQVEFDPSRVARYRLVGYENRDIADKDFRKDSVAAGQVGWGHQVTALYELELTKAHAGPLATLRIRHKQPEADTATEDTFQMKQTPAPTFAAATPDLRFAFAVAAFADVLRGGAEWSLDQIRAQAQASAGEDKDRAELVNLIDRARALRGTSKQIATDGAKAAR